ncbi:hypothetical protein HBDW_19130 [Herbaspirillum sp. DW155]|nr:hypothetical protein HBDW_19130 [Herbaspirillum sp. DW155]
MSADAFELFMTLALLGLGFGLPVAVLVFGLVTK